MKAPEAEGLALPTLVTLPQRIRRTTTSLRRLPRRLRWTLPLMTIEEPDRVIDLDARVWGSLSAADVAPAAEAR